MNRPERKKTIADQKAFINGKKRFDPLSPHLALSLLHSEHRFER
tara:strand:- start:282 stop:413 length:132 start_codon:yes stop_codon:yes gene_type:complete